MDSSILISWTSPFPILGVSGVLFHFYSISNSEDPDQKPRSAPSDLDLHYLPMSQKWDARLIWVNRDWNDQCLLKNGWRKKIYIGRVT